jgi:NAD(P)-dependent dehydrogenase (short-subunit alcohol dehydrogenase family)
LDFSLSQEPKAQSPKPEARNPEPKAVAPVFVFLASNEARFVTGEVYGVTGGKTPF